MYDETISSYCFRSAELYYNYIIDNGKGRDIVNVISINQLSNGDFLVHINKKIYDPNEIQFKIFDVIYTLEQISVVEYDAEKHILHLHPKSGFEKVLLFAQASRMNIIIDLTFLVKRVKDWYKEYSVSSLPCKKPAIEYDALDNISENMSEEQKAALQGVFAYPFTYVWGAPGTGKTRFVLANAVNICQKCDKKIAIIAPTNNALEQSLYGVLQVMEAQGISLYNVLRVGVPSRAFATQYGQCCETKGIQKRIAELDTQKNVLTKRLKVHKFNDSLYNLETNTIPLFDILGDKISVLSAMQAQLMQCSQDIEVKTLLCHKQRDEARAVSTDINLMNIRLSSPMQKLKAWLSPESVKLLKNTRLSLLDRLEKLDKASTENKQHAEKLEKQRTDLILELKEKQSEKNEIISKIKYGCCLNKRLSGIVFDLNETNYLTIFANLKELAAQGRKTLEDDNNFKREENVKDINERLEEIEAEILKLKSQTVVKRLEACKIVAITIDGYIANYSLWDGTASAAIHFDHIFLDEAGYCSLIKGAVLLNADAPITFLGDHMQLPPVCEMNDEQFELEQYRSVFLWSQSVLAIESFMKNTFEDSRKMYLDNIQPQFEQLVKLDLTSTFRFGSELSYILDKYVYLNGFHSALDNNFEIIVLHCPKEVGTRKRENPSECEGISRWLSVNEVENYAILAPYTNQVKLIGTYVNKARKDEKIMTVHASQGQEWDTVILSVSDTTDMWFTNTLNSVSKGLLLINTAVSRAKNRLIIACDTDYWQSADNQLIGALVKSAFNNSNVIYL